MTPTSPHDKIEDIMQRLLRTSQRFFLTSAFVFACIFFLGTFFYPSITHAFTIGKSNTTNNIGLVGYWTFDGKNMLTNVADSSGLGNNAMLIGFSGATSTYLTAGKIGQALTLRGIQQNNYLLSPNNTNFNFERTDPFSISAWVKPDGGFAAGCSDTIVGKFTQAGALGYGMAIQGPSCGGGVNNHSAYFFLASNTIMAVQTAANTITDNTWQHVLVTYDGTNALTGYKVYINGVLKTTTSAGGVSTLSASTKTSAQLRIGDDSTSDYFSGSLDDVRIYNRALSPAEVTQLYNLGSATKQNVSKKNGLDSGLVGYWTFDGKDMPNGVAVDKSGNGNNGNLIHIATSTFYTAGEIGQAGSFDGVDDYITTSSNVGTISSGIFTISAYIKLDHAPNNIGAVVGGAAASYPSLGISSVKKVALIKQGVSVVGSGATTLNLKQWYHIAGTYDGTNWKIYLNGNLDGSGSNAVTFSTQNTRIGFYTFSSFQEYFPGIIDDVRIYNRALSAAEVNALYQQGNAKQNASQNTQLTTGLVGYWTFDGKYMTSNVADASGNGNNAMLVGFTEATSTYLTAGKIGQALTFRGGSQSNYASSTNVSFNFERTDPFSISAWVKKGPAFPSGGSHAIAAKYDTALNRGWVLYIDGLNQVSPYISGTIFFGLYSSGSSAIGAVTNQRLATSTWYYVVATYDGSTSKTGLKIYINGQAQSVSLSSQTTLTSTILNSKPLRIGDDGTNDYFDGSMDDVRIYNRVLSPSEVTQLYNMGK